MATITTHIFNKVKLGSTIHYRNQTYTCVKHTNCGHCNLNESNICGKLTCLWLGRDKGDPFRDKKMNVMFKKRKED